MNLIAATIDWWSLRIEQFKDEHALTDQDSDNGDDFFPAILSVSLYPRSSTDLISSHSVRLPVKQNIREKRDKAEQHLAYSAHRRARKQ